MNAHTTKLRFAPLIRVSTELQEKTGESLRTQRKQIEDAVDALGGTIPKSCWQYSGQEHATAGWEREKLDKLLKDATKDKFDAVIVADATRWSRDNQKSKDGLQILRDNKIKFFVNRVEYDLYNPEQNFFLGMSSEIGEYHARSQILKSLTSRIERAKRGLPGAGKLPFGRTFNKETSTWGLDEEKLKDIKWAAVQYLEHNKTVSEIASTLGMNSSNLWKVLRHRSGTTWKIKFDVQKFNINETVCIDIPPLLSQETINSIAQKAAANKTYTHGIIKHHYLLSRVIFCEECGYAMFGQTNKTGRRYYRHPSKRARNCSSKGWVVAEEIEDAVIVHLFKMFGDVKSIKEAILKAIPCSLDITEKQQQRGLLTKKLSKTASQKKNVITSIANGTISDQEASDILVPLRDQESQIKNEIDYLNQFLENVPSSEQVEQKAKYLQLIINKIFKYTGQLESMSYEDYKGLVTHAFAGMDREGKRLGVYVNPSNDQDKSWQYTIQGILPDVEGSIPMEEWEMKEILGVDFDRVTKFSISYREQAPPEYHSRPGRRLPVG
jgi:DNA invertase Pin-like site-specific DNA recombinase